MDLKPDNKLDVPQARSFAETPPDSGVQQETGQEPVALEVQEAIENGAIIEEQPTPRGFYGIDVVSGERHLPAELSDELRDRVVDWEIPPMMQQLITKAYGIEHPIGWMVGEGTAKESKETQAEPGVADSAGLKEPEAGVEQGPVVQYSSEGENRPDSIEAQELGQTHGVGIDQAREQIEQAMKKGKITTAHELSALAEQLHGEQSVGS